MNTISDEPTFRGIRSTQLFGKCRLQGLPIIGKIPGLFLIILLSSCSASKNYNPEKLIPPAQLKADATVLWETLQECHPSLYWYTPRSVLDSVFNATIASFRDSLTESEFRTKLSVPVAFIHCGHTSLLNPKAAARNRTRSRQPFFPIQVKVWRPDSAIILASAFRRDSMLVRGTSIQKINGKSIDEIIDSMCRYISADGLHNSFKYQLISNNFPGWYKTAIGLSDQYHLDFTNLDGKADTVTIKNFDPVVEDSLRRLSRDRPRDFGFSPPRRKRKDRLLEDRKLTIDTSRSLAVMELNTFSHAQLPKFFRQSFRKIKKQGIGNLVIELRENGGGNIMNSIRLDKYISKKRFKVADSVFAKSFRYPYPRLMKNGLIYKIQGWLVTSKRKDGNHHYRLYERKYFKPFASKHFDGQVFIVTGGFTFSASTLFIDPLKGQKNVLVLGEETGGGAYGNSAVNVPELKLPNSGIRLRVPLYRLVINKNIPHDGRGILPDLEVPPTSWHLANRKDPKMEKVLELIAADKKNSGD